MFTPPPRPLPPLPRTLNNRCLGTTADVNTDHSTFFTIKPSTQNILVCGFSQIRTIPLSTCEYVDVLYHENVQPNSIPIIHSNQTYDVLFSCASLTFHLFVSGMRSLNSVEVQYNMFSCLLIPVLARA